MAIGRLPSRKPARASRTASLTALTASSCPMTRWCSRSSILVRRSRSSLVSSVTGMPVSFDTTWAMCSVRTSAEPEPRSRRQRSCAVSSSFALASCCACRSLLRSKFLRELA